ncbi:Acetyltransferase (GNAT) domain-containing protein [Burkholderia sp. WP9]|uniref:GNAT family N-acetyltransferase n=1 Tax=Burkholderia sp. WP9 TaxID=1500263 RepID=UPI000899238C|nr:GNAT family N-acetyltransferase [Burkholderia sp. WP9]SEF13325.1 Acetyltransferase (GNAT) domain-containing protein [Burkholderia sp. WP9]
MGEAPFHLAPLDASHERQHFHSGAAAPDHYFHHQVTQDVRRRVTACFVALGESRIAGYYTLASASVSLAALPAALGRKLPRYPSVPAVRMGRLAVDADFRGQGLGGALLADALARVMAADIAAWALVVDAKDEAAAAFYRHHGLIALPDSPLMLFLPLATAQAAHSAGRPAARKGR